jgi:hypothetical protein
MAGKKVKSGEKAGAMSSNRIKTGSDPITQKPAAQFTSFHIDKLYFESLVKTITKIHENLFTQAVKAVNVSLTIRNWLIGFYIHEYELGGRDRAAYGEHLFEKLANRLHELGIKRIYERELRRYRQFYLTYPRIRESLSPEFSVGGITLIKKLSFSHIIKLMQIEDTLKRTFYEIECIGGNWSVPGIKKANSQLIL